MRPAETSEQQIAEHYRQLMGVLPTAVYTCAAPSGVITYYNELAVQLWGRSPPLNDPDERFCGSFRLFLPDGRPLPHAETPMAIALSEGRPFRNVEVVMEREDGRRFTLRANIEPLRDASGRVVGAVNALHDVTSLKAAQAATQESERRLRELVDALPAAVYMTDVEGRITMFNQAAVEFSGRTPALGTDTWCVSWRLYRTDGTPLPHDECPLAQTLRGVGSLRGAEAVAERPDGRRITFAAYPTLLRDASGAPIGAINMLVDVTERKRAEIELLRSHEELRQRAEELARFNRVAVGRELRMIDLKREVNALCRRLGEPERYELAVETEAGS